MVNFYENSLYDCMIALVYDDFGDSSMYKERLIFIIKLFPNLYESMVITTQVSWLYKVTVDF